MNGTFDWGLLAKTEDNWFQRAVTDEIFNLKIYEKFFTVEPGDVVFDIGASVGPFTHSIRNNQAKAIYCFEPHPELFKTLCRNVSREGVYCINKAILDKDGQQYTYGLFNPELGGMKLEENYKLVPSTSFQTFIEKNAIDQIDFLKIDAEGGEYDIFTEENFEWIRNNVKKIVGEWHLVDEEQKSQFKKFRDLYLRHLTRFEVYAINDVDIKDNLWTDEWIDFYGIITLYIDNR